MTVTFNPQRNNQFTAYTEIIGTARNDGSIQATSHVSFGDRFGMFGILFVIESDSPHCAKKTFEILNINLHLF